LDTKLVDVINSALDHGPPKPELVISESLRFAYDTFISNKVRFLLTALGMMIGTASLVLVVTIGLTGKQYILDQIQGIGANLIYASYAGGGQRITAVALDELTVDDLTAVREQVPSVVAATPFVSLNDRISVGNGKEQDISILGVFPEYSRVRNLVLLAGRFFDAADSQGRNKVGVITEKLAVKLFQTPESAVGQVIKLNGLPFTVIGVFKERVETFGQSEVEENTMAIPYSVSRFFLPSNAVRQIYFTVASPDEVTTATAQIKRVLQSRHRPESVQRGEPDATGELGEQDGEYSDDGVVVDCGGSFIGQWHRHHEHHAGYGQRPHSRDRNPQSGRRHQTRDSPPVSLRGHPHLPQRRRPWHHHRTRHPLFRPLPHRLSHPHFRSLRHHRHRRLLAGRHSVWYASRHPRRSTRSCREPALRVAICTMFTIAARCPRTGEISPIVIK